MLNCKKKRRLENLLYETAIYKHIMCIQFINGFSSFSLEFSLAFS